MIMYRINPTLHKVEELIYNGTYADLYKRMRFDLVETMTVGKCGDHMAVDADLQKERTEEGFSWLSPTGQLIPYVGQALLYGTLNGQLAAPSLSITEVRLHIAWQHEAPFPEELHMPELASLEDLLNSIEY